VRAIDIKRRRPPSTVCVAALRALLRCAAVLRRVFLFCWLLWLLACVCESCYWACSWPRNRSIARAERRRRQPPKFCNAGIRTPQNRTHRSVHNQNFRSTSTWATTSASSTSP
jgi:hypothetical protein